MRTPFSQMATLSRLAITLGVLSSSIVFAQEQPVQPEPTATTSPAPTAVPVVPTATSTSAPGTPSRGATMTDVRSKFGAPAQESPAVGLPPITRWEYPGYVVFFEHDRVLHTVVVKS